MSKHLNPTITDRNLWPFAVSVQMPGEPAPTFVHFDHLGSAALYASLLDSPSNDVRRYVANLSTPVLYSAAVGVGWFEVGTFDPALSAEVRAVCIGRVGALQ